jgi:MFS family permease
MVLIYTNLGRLELWQVITCNILLFIGIMSRMVPSTAMVSSLPEMKDRGAFMSVMSSLQQLAGGLAAVIAGLIVHQATPTSPLENFDILGIVVAVCIVATVYGLYRVSLLIKKKS